MELAAESCFEQRQRLRHQKPWWATRSVVGGSQGTASTRMTGKPGGVSPFQDLRLGRIRNEHPVRWAPPLTKHEAGRMVSDSEGVAEELYRWERESGFTFLDPGR
jgi:hypothetical protein